MMRGIAAADVYYFKDQKVMEKYSQKIGVVILFVCGGIFAAAAGPSPCAVAETLLVKQEYDAAGEIVCRRLQTAPEDNYALYLRIAIEQTEILDYESYYLRGGRFLAAADSVRKVLEERLSKLSGKDSTLCLFYIANLYGGMGLIKAKTGSWFSGLKNSLKSVGMLKEVAQRDSAMYAAMLGTGAFHYYLSKNFGWLPFIDADSEKKGISEVEKATCAPFPYGFAAKNSLCWILIEQKQFGRADSVALSVLKETPGNTIFQRIRCLIALWSGHYEQALMLAQKLSEVSLMRDPVNWSDYVMSYYVLTSSYDGLGKVKEAITVSHHILGVKIPPEFRAIPPIKKNLKRILAIKNKYH
jgi:hypothetical protein